MTTSESHGAISGSRVSEEIARELRNYANVLTNMGASRPEHIDRIKALAALSRRSEPSEPVAWQAILQRAIEGNPTVESPEDHVEYLLGCIRAALASPQPGASS